MSDWSWNSDVYRFGRVGERGGGGIHPNQVLNCIEDEYWCPQGGLFNSTLKSMPSNQIKYISFKITIYKTKTKYFSLN